MKEFKKYSRENINFFEDSAPTLLENLIKKKSPSKLADFGCGDGAILFNLYKKGLLTDKNFVMAIDLSEERLERIKRYLPEIKTLRSDACDVKKIKSCSLDLAISTQVIEHVESDKKLLNELFRVLKPEGTLYISSIIKKKYGWWIYKCNGKVTCDPTHVREYKSVDEFINLLESSGFSVISKKTSLFKPSIGNFLRRAFLKYNLISEERLRLSKIGKTLTSLKIPSLGYFIIEVVAIKKK